MRLMVSFNSQYWLKKVKELLDKGYANSLGLLAIPSISTSMANVIELGIPWAADNGAFSGFDEYQFLVFLNFIRDQPGCMWVACPDKVGDAKSTIIMYEQWVDEIKRRGQPVAFVLQDGQENLELPDADAYFVGGSTKFKLSRAADSLIQECKRRGKLVHMGRVNSKQRAKHAHKRGVDSIDGTCMRFSGFGAVVRLCEYIHRLNHYKGVTG